MESKPNSFLITLLSILLLISCIIAGFFAYQTQQLVKQLTAYSVQIKPTPTPTPTPDPTADWKLINLPHWSFKVPQDWYISNCDSKFYVLGPEILKDDTTCRNGGTFYIARQSKSIFSNKVPWDSYLNKPNVKIDITEVIIDQKNATRWILILPGNMLDNPKVEIEHENYWDRISYDTKVENTVNQILSTFKFTGSEPVSSPVACTMEAKVCPDGSSVGRSGPKCEFAPCP